MSLSRASHIVVMGVCGSGKSTVAQLLATRLGLPFIEGDAWHPLRNVERMAAGQPLTDEDRRDWLLALNGQLMMAQETGGVLACSALKRSYRDRLREGAPGLRLVHLTGSPSVLSQRLQARQGHYMPPRLLQSQLDTLEPPAADEHAVVLNIETPPDQMVEAVCRQWDLPSR